jgi:hypothetical protein
MSNLNLIDLSIGTKLIELNNHVVMSSERNDPITRKSFME